MRISQVSAVGDAVLSSAYSLIDDRATRAQAVDAANIELVAGGHIGATTLPMTVRTAADGAVRKASAGGSVYLASPLGVLTVLDGGANSGQMALNGSAAGLSLGGRIQTARGLALTAGRYAINLTAGADLRNATGSAVLQGESVTMADGASIDGGAGTLVLSANGDIKFTGLRSANNSAGAIVVSSSGGALLDGGETDADITIMSTNGTAVLSAYGNVGNASLGATASDHALETAAPSLIVTSKTGSVSLAQQGDLSDAIVSARQGADLHSDAKVVATQVSSSLGSVSVSSENAGVRLASVRSAQDVTVAAAGQIELASFTVPRHLSITTTGTATNPAHGQGVVAGSLTAGGNLTISSSGASADGRFAGLSSRSGVLQVDAGGSLSISGVAKASGEVDLKADGQLNVGAVSSSASGVSLSANNGGIRYASVSAAGVARLSATRGNGSTVATDILGGGITARALDPASAVNVTAVAGTVALGNVSASTGGVSLASSGGGLGVGTVRASGDILLGSRDTMKTGALTSSAGKIVLNADAGVLSVASAIARTGLDAASGTAMSIQSFSVSQGTASLRADTELTLPKGSARGGLTLQAGNHAWLGSLVSSAGRIDVTSLGGGIRFTSLKAATGLAITAKQAFGSGPNPSYSLVGGTLDAGTGGVDAIATAGDLLISKLLARNASSLNVLEGQLRVSSIGSLTPGQLTANAAAGTSLPKGY
jgi:hypothetical protein